MARQHCGAFRALVIGMGLLFSWSGMVSMADAQATTEESTVQSTDTREHGDASVGKRKGQSPSNKRASKKAESKTKGKRKGQAPENKPTQKDAPPVEGRQGQSPSADEGAY